MTDGIRAWWASRAPREQRLILAAAGLAAAVLAWLLIVRPLGDALADARARHAAGVTNLAEVRAQADAIARARAVPPANLGATVEAVISQAASDAGFPPTRIEAPSGTAATLTIDAVRPQAFFGWVRQMEARGLLVERLTARTNADRTLAVTVSFRARGS